MVECSSLETVCEFKRDDAIDHANARLIAAAPDLYAALQLIVDHYGDPLEVARAALAKAEGQTS